MGRPPLEEQAIRETTIQLVETARELILSQRLKNVTIRKIAAKSGLNSAVIYKHFQDLDELLCFACVDLFRSYCYDLAQRTQRLEFTDPRRTYELTWQVFCQYAFRYPDVMNHLFFNRHSSCLGHVIQAYYDLFPEQLEGMSSNLQMMIRSANLYQRNLEVLEPLLGGNVSADRLQLINELTVAYFRMLLEEKNAGGDTVDSDAQTRRMLAACAFLVEPS